MCESNETISFLREHFTSLEDPRGARGRMHPFFSVLTIAILAAICGADEWTEVEEYGKSKVGFVSQFLELPHGVPSHDTFGRVFSLIDPEPFGACFSAWTARMADTFGEIVNIDGKQLRGSYDTEDEKAAIHMVSAWANEHNMVLGQVKVDDQSNEITAIPKLLSILKLEGALITIDAIGTQQKIAAQIQHVQADYLLALKGNQAETHPQVVEAFELFEAGRKTKMHQELDMGHGRIEKRTCFVAPARDWLLAENYLKWKGLKTLVKVSTEVEQRNGKHKGQVARETRYYLVPLRKRQFKS